MTQVVPAVHFRGCNDDVDERLAEISRGGGDRKSMFPTLVLGR